uniref:Uncharacterized protein n=1 Tax=Anguilla anguilla TaxID=7936 RepID=A0A0E9U3F0_ANGAN
MRGGEMWLCFREVVKQASSSVVDGRTREACREGHICTFYRRHPDTHMQKVISHLLTCL